MRPMDKPYVYINKHIIGKGWYLNAFPSIHDEGARVATHIRDLKTAVFTAEIMGYKIIDSWDYHPSGNPGPADPVELKKAENAQEENL